MNRRHEWRQPDYVDAFYRFLLFWQREIRRTIRREPASRESQLCTQYGARRTSRARRRSSR